MFGALYTDLELNLQLLSSNPDLGGFHKLLNVFNADSPARR
jgi:hypothetical protein